MQTSKNKLRWVDEVYKALTTFAQNNLTQSINAACEESLTISNCFRFLYKGKLIAPIDMDNEFITDTAPQDLTDHPDIKKFMDDIEYKRGLLFTGKHVIHNYFRMIAWKSDTLDEFLHKVPPVLANAALKVGVLTSEDVFTAETFIQPENYDKTIEDRILDLYTARLLW